MPITGTFGLQVAATTTRCTGCVETYLSQLEDVLFAVNDLESAAWQPGADIASVQPAVLVQHFPRLLLVLIVPFEDGGPPHADLHTPMTQTLIFLGTAWRCTNTLPCCSWLFSST